MSDGLGFKLNQKKSCKALLNEKALLHLDFKIVSKMEWF